MIVDVALSRDSKTGKYTGLWQPQLKHKLIKMSHSKPLFNFFRSSSNKQYNYYN